MSPSPQSPGPEIFHHSSPPLWIDCIVLSFHANVTSFANAHSQVIFAISEKRGWKVSCMTVPIPSFFTFTQIPTSSSLQPRFHISFPHKYSRQSAPCSDVFPRENIEVHARSYCSYPWRKTSLASFDSFNDFAWEKFVLNIILLIHLL